jgi:hypothetical protein
MTPLSFEEKSRICRDSSGIVVNAAEAEPGTIFFAARKKVPADRLRRMVWEAVRRLELNFPRAIPALARTWTDNGASRMNSAQSGASRNTPSAAIPRSQ